MDNSKRNLSILSCAIITVCLVTVFMAVRYYNTDEKKVQQNYNLADEEINLGDNCSDCKSLCKHYGGTNCDSQCASSCATATATPKPTATPAPTATPTPTPLVCTSGQYKSDGSCVTCEKGYKCDGEDRTACAAGTYQDEEGKTSCKDCTKGHKCPGTGNTGVTDCPAGTYQDSTGQADCKNCAKGKYQDKTAKTSCSSCAAGTYQDEEGKTSCKDCTTGHKCPGTGNTAPTDCEEKHYQDETKQTSCKKCFGVVSDDKASCDECKINSFTSNLNRVSTGDSFVVSLFATKGCKNYSIKIDAPNDSSGASGTTVGEGSVISQVSITAGSPTCATHKVSVSISGDDESIGSSVSVYVSKEWQGPKAKGVYKKALPVNGTSANLQEKDTYGTCNPHPDDPTKYLCVDIYNRGCSPEQEEPHYNYCCMDREYLGLSKQTDWEEYRLKKECPNSETFPYMILQTDANKEKINKSTCKEYKVPGRCTPSEPKVTGKTVYADICEDSKAIVLDDTSQSCVNKSDGFYTIDCKRKIYTDFDYGSDGSQETNRTIFGGQGFKFSINAGTEVTCEATFNDSVWNNVYNKFVKKIEYIDDTLVTLIERDDDVEWKKRVDKLVERDHLSKNTQSDLYNLWNIIDELRQVAIGYNKFNPTDNYAENSVLKLSYKLKDESNTIEDTFVFDKTISEGSFKYTKSETQPDLVDPYFSDNCYTGTVSEIKERCNPLNYEVTNKDDKRVVKFNAKQTYIKRYDGKVTTETESTIDGGNKIYTEYDIDKGYWPITITVSGLAGGSQVINEKCDVYTNDVKLQYRSIDVGNPFINGGWDRGENWVSSKYDFTQTIHSTTWSEATQNTINISGDDVKSIQNSNASYRSPKKDSTTGEMVINSPYLGLCDVESYSDHDDITKKICDAIK